jgi:hypothetical protein
LQWGDRKLNPTHAPNPRQGNPECWSGGHNYARCGGGGSGGGGDPNCWGGTYNCAFC